MLLTNSISNAACQNNNNSYIMNPNNQLVGMRKGGRFNQSVILEYQDKTEWVFLNNKTEERFCGFLYLQKAINDSNLHTLQAAENKIAIHDRKIIYLSRYYGDKKPEFMELFEYNNEISILQQKIGFIDMTGNCNLRKKDNFVYVFDTEKTSFDKSVHEKIDSFVHQHNVIRSILEESLKNH
jgi:hypothetical protein